MATRIDEILAIRREKLSRIEKMGINPYPSVVKRDHEIGKVVENFEKFENVEVNLAGRLVSFREHGKVSFGQIQDQTGKIQLFIREDVLGITDLTLGNIGYSELGLFDVGDFVQAFGKVVKTKTGEVSIEVKRLWMIGKSLRPLPSDWFGLSDVEERYRKRYLDLLINPEVRKRFDIKTKIFRQTRNYLDDLGFMEVETPVFHPQYGGANAKPFKSHMNALGVDLYLRIAFELYLKRLVVGGYEKVYEIGRDFRNEGIDLTHSPEFSMIEWYEAYADYHRVMEVTEGLFKHLAKTVLGTTKLKVENGEVEIGHKWERYVMTDLINQRLEIDALKMTVDELVRYCEQNKIDLVGGESKGQLIFTIFDEKISKTLINPTWVIDYPVEVSPLSKDHRSKKGMVERFEGYIGGKEICDGWSELTNPIEQRKRFESDVRAVRKKTDEAQMVDEDYLEAMEYGMPPMGGIGIGMERLTMFFTNVWSIRENILFPTLKPKM